MVAIQKKPVKAGKLVNTEHVNALISNYKKERWVHNSKRIGKEDSLSVWYSIEELEEFLAKAKEHGADGVKLYFGAYDKEHAPKELYEDRQTVVFVATRERRGVEGVQNKDLYINKDGDNTILAYNFGTLCPPFCTQGDGDPEIGITIIDKGEEGIVVA